MTCTGRTFSPKTREALISAVNACVGVTRRGDGSGGHHGPVSEWDVSQVTNMDDTFFFATGFNQQLSKWKVDDVTDMENMFSYASSFNGDISKWNVGKVINMASMFRQANSFNHDLSEWDVAEVVDMYNMFNGAISFKQVLCGEAWVKSRANKGNMFQGSPGSIATRVCFSPRSRFQARNATDLQAAVRSCLGRLSYD